jgi:BASS family bile acid:Na+ symporter
VLIASCIAFVLALFYTGLGLAVGAARGGILKGLSCAICLTFLNNVLLVVFASRFFGPLPPLLAAVYMLPFFLMVIPLRMVRGREPSSH